MIDLNDLHFCNNVENRALNSMNYFLLRAVFKEDYPESIKEELSFFLEGISVSLQRSDMADKIAMSSLYHYAYQEIDEGEYEDDISEIPNRIRNWCEENTDLTDDEITKIFQFYGTVCCDVIEKRNKEFQQEL